MHGYYRISTTDLPLVAPESSKTRKLKKMTPWIIDAKDIEVTGLSDFRESLFHTNAQINRFLNDESKEQVLVVGPKGFGKTLLLKVKRKGMERGSYTFFPEDALVDKPIGTPHIFAFRDFQDLLEKDEYWRHVWLIAVILSLLKIQRVKVSFKSVQSYARKLVTA